MTKETDKEYYLRRAEEEILRARDAVSEEAVRLHYHLGSFYLDRAHSPSDPDEGGEG